MNAFHIKILAIILMLIDHIGLFFFPQDYMFRIVGRLSFPLFAWLIANGARHTNNINAYTIRIFLFAVLSQLPYVLANEQTGFPYANLNVLFTLGFGLLAIFFIKQTRNRQWWLLITVLCAAAAQILEADYGAVGVVSVVAYYLFFNTLGSLMTAQFVIYAFPFLFLAGYRNAPFEPLALFSLCIIALYNKKEGIKAKYLFYIIYPLQYLFFYVAMKLWG